MRSFLDVIAYAIRGTLGWLVLRAFRTRSLRRENVPPKGQGAILAGNHVSYADPMLLWCAAPRRTHFMAKAELWQIKPLGWALDLLWAFQVHRGAADRQAIQTATEMLGSGELVGIFPEGTRTRGDSDELGEAQGGVAFIAIRANAPVVPVGIANTDKIMPPGRRIMRFPRVTIVYGTPIHPDDVEGATRRERVAAMTTEIMRRIVLARDEAREVAR